MSNVIILGDSFSNNTCNKNEINKDIAWFIELKKYLNDRNFLNISRGSKDFQSIIDEWIKLIPLLDENDILIIWFPHLSRFRIPLIEENYISNKFKKEKIIDRFIGYSNEYNLTKKDTEIYDIGYDREYFRNSLKDQLLINKSNANKLNFLEVIESLHKITLAKTYLFTWDILKFHSDVLYDKKIIQSKIGIWETKHDYFLQTNGKYGITNDDHFSYKTHLAFFEYLKNIIK